MEPKTEEPHWFWKLFRHPLFISVIAIVFFGIIINFIGFDISECKNQITKGDGLHWFWKLLRHPLFISVIATGFFGIMIAFIGSHLQHRNWHKQTEIESSNLIQGKVFDKRADILEEVFYVIPRRSQIFTQIFFAQSAILEAKKKNDRNAIKRFYEEYREYAELNDELEARSGVITTNMRIFFDWRKHQEIIPVFIEIHELFNQMHNKILRDAKSGNLSKDEFIKERKTIDDLRENLHLMFKEILYYPEIKNIEKAN